MERTYRTIAFRAIKRMFPGCIEIAKSHQMWKYLQYLRTVKDEDQGGRLQFMTFISVY